MPAIWVEVNPESCSGVSASIWLTVSGTIDVADKPLSWVDVIPGKLRRRQRANPGVREIVDLRRGQRAHLRPGDRRELRHREGVQFGRCQVADLVGVEAADLRRRKRADLRRAQGPQLV